MAVVAVVRYGVMGTTERFSTPQADFKPEAGLIVRTRRGVEWGELMLLRQRTPEDERFAGEVLRQATPSDRKKHEDILERQEPQDFQTCRKLIEQHGLAMKLVHAEHLFGDNKIIFYFLAEGRVDFRELVSDLAKEYRTRIEMRQIGVRDEARLLGLWGPCGREICCRGFLKSLKPVPMKLAKHQKSTLDPAKISGACGRLKCCLKFEESLYKEFSKNLPRRGAKVETPDGKGQVVEHEILSQSVVVLLNEGKKKKFPATGVRMLKEK